MASFTLENLNRHVKFDTGKQTLWFFLMHDGRAFTVTWTEPVRVFVMDVKTGQAITYFVVEGANGKAFGICYRKSTNTILLTTIDPHEVWEVNLDGSDPKLLLELENYWSSVYEDGDMLYGLERKASRIAKYNTTTQETEYIDLPDMEPTGITRAQGQWVVTGPEHPEVRYYDDGWALQRSVTLPESRPWSVRALGTGEVLVTGTSARRVWLLPAGEGAEPVDLFSVAGCSWADEPYDVAVQDGEFYTLLRAHTVRKQTIVRE